MRVEVVSSALAAVVALEDGGSFAHHGATATDTPRLLVLPLSQGRPSPVLGEEGTLAEGAWAEGTLVVRVAELEAPGLWLERRRRQIGELRKGRGGDGDDGRFLDALTRFECLATPWTKSMDNVQHLPQVVENVVFILYNFTRICGILRRAREDPVFQVLPSDEDVSKAKDWLSPVLTVPKPRIDSCRPIRRLALPHELSVWAKSFSKWYGSHRVLNPASPTFTAACLILLDGIRSELQICFHVIGIDPPLKM